MKTCLSALFALATGLTFGQSPGSAPPATGTATVVQAVALQKRSYRPALPPDGGFWVLEKMVDGPTVANFYTAGRQKLQTDTLRQKFPNLKRRVVLVRLNNRLQELLDEQNAPASVAVRQP